MAVKIRLTRLGDCHAPFYRIVVSDSRKARDGKYIEQLGTFNPKATTEDVTLNVERANYWLTNGAEPSDTVKALLKKNGVELKAKKVAKPSAKKASKNEVKKSVAKKETK